MIRPLARGTPAFLKSMVAPLQKRNTARMGIAPDFHRWVVKVPSKAVQNPGKKVLTHAPISRGTTIMPPGTFFTVCRIFML